MAESEVSVVGDDPNGGNVSVVPNESSAQGPAADPVKTPGAEGQPADQEASGAAGGDPASAQTPVAPEKYELKAPEGLAVDEAAMSEVTPILQGLKCDQATAQKLADFHFKQLRGVLAQGEKVRAEAIAGWERELRADPDIGGPKLMENMSYGTKLLNKYGTPELGKLLVDFGLDRNPTMVKFLVTVGKRFAEDHWADGGRHGTPVKTADDVAKLLFDKSLSDRQ